MTYSANTDPELTLWLRWASESGEVSSFIQTVAEAAAIADLPHYALLRPVLLELKRETPRECAILDILRLGSWVFLPPWARKYEY
jgi:hypothetical protein